MLATRVGSLVLHVPKFRDGTLGAELFTRYQRSEQALLLSLMAMVIHGGSTRRISAITETLCGTSFSTSTVSALCGQLDPVVDAFRNRPLSRHYPFLMVDALTMKARGQHRIVSKGFLIAMGVNDEGVREVLGFTVADEESETAWDEFFLSLKQRGLENGSSSVEQAGSTARPIAPRMCWAELPKGYSQTSRLHCLTWRTRLTSPRPLPGRTTSWSGTSNKPPRRWHCWMHGLMRSLLSTLCRSRTANA